MPLLSVRNLCVYFPSRQGLARAVDGISFDLYAGQIMALVGETGCGKTATARALLGLHPPPTRISGSIHFEGRSLVGVPHGALQEIRGKGIGMVFQDPGTSLDPLYSVGKQLAEVVRLHRRVGRWAGSSLALELLRDVRLTPPERIARSCPHELSGGMQQRVAIALALAGAPRLLVADEPTASLDAAVQAEIVELLRDLCARRGMALLLITHDLDMVAHTADRVAVMYAGKIVEEGPAEHVFRRPYHPYTAALLACRPRLGGSGRLRSIDGRAPAPASLPAGCRFRDRCEYRDEQCVREPLLEECGPGHRSACWHWDQLAGRHAESETAV